MASNTTSSNGPQVVKLQQTTDRLRLETSKLRDHLRSERDAVRELRAQHATQLRTERTAARRRNVELEAQLSSASKPIVTAAVGLPSCEQCSKLRALHEGDLRRERTEQKKRESQLRAQLNTLRRCVNSGQGDTVCQQCAKFSQELTKQKELTKELEERLQNAVEADRLKGADLRAQHEKHVTELARITRAQKHDAHILLEELKTKDRIIEQLRRTIGASDHIQPVQMRKLREDVRKTEPKLLSSTVYDPKTEPIQQNDKDRVADLSSTIKHKEQMTCGGPGDDLEQSTEEDTDSAVSSAPSSLSPQPCSPVNDECRPLRCTMVSRTTNTSAILQESPPPTSLSPQPSEGYTTPPPGLWSVDHECDDDEHFEHDDSVETENELMMAKRQVRELERALLVTRAAKSGHHVMALSDRIRQLEDHETELLRELGDLREQNELLEFRVFELAECHDKPTTIIGSQWTEKHDACTGTNDDVYLLNQLNEDSIRSRLLAMSKRTTDTKDNECLLKVLMLLYGLDELSRRNKDVFSIEMQQNQEEMNLPQSIMGLRATREKQPDRLIAKVPPFTGRTGVDSDDDRASPVRADDALKSISSCGTQTDSLPEHIEINNRSLNLTAEVRKLDRLRESIEVVGNRNGRFVVGCGDEQKHARQIEFYRERVDVLERKVRVYESSGDTQARELAERLSREVCLEAQVKQLTLTVQKLQNENSRLEEERCELEEAENDTRLRCQRLETEKTQLERSKMAAKRKAKDSRSQAAYWESMVSKYEERNYELEERECELRHRLEVMEKTAPAILLFNMWKMMQENPSIDAAEAAIDRLKRCGGNRDRSRSRTKSRSPQQRGDSQCPKPNVCDKIKTLEEERDRLSQHNSAGVGYEGSISSITTNDLQLLKCVQELKDREHDLKRQIGDLEQREAAYMETLQQADDIWAEMETSYKKKISESELNEANMRDKLRKLQKNDTEDVDQLEQSERQLAQRATKLERENGRLVSENKRLENELFDIRGDAVKRAEDKAFRLSTELDREKRRSQQLAAKLNDNVASMNDAGKSHQCEIDALKERMSRTTNELFHLEVTNGELREEVDTLECKIAELDATMRKRAATDEQMIRGLSQELNDRDRELSGMREKGCAKEAGERLSAALQGVRNCNVCSSSVSPDLMQTVEGVRTLCELVSCPPTRPPDDAQVSVKPSVCAACPPDDECEEKCSIKPCGKDRVVKSAPVKSSPKAAVPPAPKSAPPAAKPAPPLRLPSVKEAMAVLKKETSPVVSLGPCSCDTESPTPSSSPTGTMEDSLGPCSCDDSPLSGPTSSSYSSGPSRSSKPSSSPTGTRSGTSSSVGSQLCPVTCPSMQSRKSVDFNVGKSSASRKTSSSGVSSSGGTEFSGTLTTTITSSSGGTAGTSTRSTSGVTGTTGTTTRSTSGGTGTTSRTTGTSGTSGYTGSTTTGTITGTITGSTTASRTISGSYTTQGTTPIQSSYGTKTTTSSGLTSDACNAPCNSSGAPTDQYDLMTEVAHVGNRNYTNLTNNIAIDPNKTATPCKVLANVTQSGNLEIITEGPPGIVEHTMQVTTSGNMELTSQYQPADVQSQSYFHEERDPKGPDIPSHFAQMLPASSDEITDSSNSDINVIDNSAVDSLTSTSCYESFETEPSYKDGLSNIAEKPYSSNVATSETSFHNIAISSCVNNSVDTTLQEALKYLPEVISNSSENYSNIDTIKTFRHCSRSNYMLPAEKELSSNKLVTLRETSQRHEVKSARYRWNIHHNEYKHIPRPATVPRTAKDARRYPVTIDIPTCDDITDEQINKLKKCQTNLNKKIKHRAKLEKIYEIKNDNEFRFSDYYELPNIPQEFFIYAAEDGQPCTTCQNAPNPAVPQCGPCMTYNAENGNSGVPVPAVMGYPNTVPPVLYSLVPYMPTMPYNATRNFNCPQTCPMYFSPQPILYYPAPCTGALGGGTPMLPPDASNAIPCSQLGAADVSSTCEVAEVMETEDIEGSPELNDLYLSDKDESVKSGGETISVSLVLEVEEGSQASIPPGSMTPSENISIPSLTKVSSTPSSKATKSSKGSSRVSGKSSGARATSSGEGSGKSSGARAISSGEGSVKSSGISSGKASGKSGDARAISSAEGSGKSSGAQGLGSAEEDEVCSGPCSTVTSGGSLSKSSKSKPDSKLSSKSKIPSRTSSQKSRSSAGVAGEKGSASQVSKLTPKASGTDTKHVKTCTCSACKCNPCKDSRIPPRVRPMPPTPSHTSGKGAEAKTPRCFKCYCTECRCPDCIDDSMRGGPPRPKPTDTDTSKPDADVLPDTTGDAIADSESGSARPEDISQVSIAEEPAITATAAGQLAERAPASRNDDQPAIDAVVSGDDTGTVDDQPAIHSVVSGDDTGAVDDSVARAADKTLEGDATADFSAASTKPSYTGKPCDCEEPCDCKPCKDPNKLEPKAEESGEAPTGDTTTEDTPAEDAPTDGAPAEDASTDGAPAGGTFANDATAAAPSDAPPGKKCTCVDVCDCNKCTDPSIPAKTMPCTCIGDCICDPCSDPKYFKPITTSSLNEDQPAIAADIDSMGQEFLDAEGPPAEPRKSVTFDHTDEDETTSGELSHTINPPSQYGSSIPTDEEITQDGTGDDLLGMIQGIAQPEACTSEEPAAAEPAAAEPAAAEPAAAEGDKCLRCICRFITSDNQNAVNVGERVVQIQYPDQPDLTQVVVTVDHPADCSCPICRCLKCPSTADNKPYKKVCDVCTCPEMDGVAIAGGAPDQTRTLPPSESQAGDAISADKTIPIIYPDQPLDGTQVIVTGQFDSCECPVCKCKTCEKMGNIGGAGESGAEGSTVEPSLAEPAECEAADATVPDAATSDAATPDAATPDAATPEGSPTLSDECICPECECTDCSLMPHKDELTTEETVDAVESPTVRLPTSLVGPSFVKCLCKEKQIASGQKASLRPLAVTDADDFRNQDTDTLKGRLSEMEREAKDRVNEIAKIRKFMDGLRCACNDQMQSAQENKPFIAPEPSRSFGSTMSGLQCAVAFLQDKCRTKDRMIAAITDELRMRTDSGVFENIFKTVNTERDLDTPSFNRQTLSNALPRPDTNDPRQVLRTPAEKPHPSQPRVSVPTSNSPPACECSPMPANSSPLAINEMRRVSPDSLLLKWERPDSKQIKGYEIEINGCIKSRVHSSGRTATIVHGLQMKDKLNISVYAMTLNGSRCAPPATAVYQPRPMSPPTTGGPMACLCNTTPDTTPNNVVCPAEDTSPDTTDCTTTGAVADTDDDCGCNECNCSI